jgi:hypothetical protein
MDKPIRFKYTAPIGATPTLVPFPEDLTEAGAARLQIRNTGGAALTAMTLKSQADQEAIAVNVITTSEQWVAGALIVDLSGNPFTLAAGATSDLLINCKGQVELIFEATCGTSTTLSVLGWLFPDGGAV